MTAVHHSLPTPLIALLAAGSARRFGGGKLDARLGNRALGEWSLATARTTGFDVAVVVGPTIPAFVRDTPAPQQTHLIDNPLAAAGMGTSVAAAARAAIAGGHSGLIIMLADMPFVTQDRLVDMADPDHARFARHPGCIAGPPAWIPSRFLSCLVGLTGEAGARSVLDAGDIQLIDWPADQLIDIDTPQALARAGAIIAGQEAPPSPCPA